MVIEKSKRQLGYFLKKTKKLIKSPLFLTRPNTFFIKPKSTKVTGGHLSHFYNIKVGRFEA